MDPEFRDLIDSELLPPSNTVCAFLLVESGIVTVEEFLSLTSTDIAEMKLPEKLLNLHAKLKANTTNVPFDYTRFRQREVLRAMKKTSAELMELAQIDKKSVLLPNQLLDRAVDMCRRHSDKSLYESLVAAHGAAAVGGRPRLEQFRFTQALAKELCTLAAKQLNILRTAKSTDIILHSMRLLNFGPFQNATVVLNQSFGAPFHRMLIGTNGTGKTTLLRAIFLLLDSLRSGTRHIPTNGGKHNKNAGNEGNVNEDDDDEDSNNKDSEANDEVEAKNVLPLGMIVAVLRVRDSANVQVQHTINVRVNSFMSNLESTNNGDNDIERQTVEVELVDNPFDCPRTALDLLGRWPQAYFLQAKAAEQLKKVIPRPILFRAGGLALDRGFEKIVYVAGEADLARVTSVIRQFSPKFNLYRLDQGTIQVTEMGIRGARSSMKGFSKGTIQFVEILLTCLLAEKGDLLLFDEPDAFINPLKLLSHFLFKELPANGKSVVVCTHATELMISSESKLEDSLPQIMELHNGAARSLGDSLDFMRALKLMGSAIVTPKELSQLAFSPDLLVFENRVDFQFLQELLALEYPGDQHLALRTRFAAMVALPLGGRPHAQTIVGLVKSLQKFVDQPVKAFVFADSDFHRRSFFDDEKKLYEAAGVRFFRWDRREFENFFLHDEALYAYTLKAAATENAPPPEKAAFKISFWRSVKAGIESILDELTRNAPALFATEFASHETRSALEKLNNMQAVAPSLRAHPGLMGKVEAQLAHLSEEKDINLRVIGWFVDHKFVEAKKKKPAIEDIKTFIADCVRQSDSLIQDAKAAREMKIPACLEAMCRWIDPKAFFKTLHAAPPPGFDKDTLKPKDFGLYVKCLKEQPKSNTRENWPEILTKVAAALQNSLTNQKNRPSTHEFTRLVKEAESADRKREHEQKVPPLKNADITMKVEAQAGDGHCLFHCVNSAVFGGAHKPEDLRARMADFVLNDQSELAVSLREAISCGALASLEAQNRVFEITTPEEYADFIRSNGWGGESELEFFAKLFAVQIFVVHVADMTRIQEASYGDANAPFVMWLEFDGRHFNLIATPNARQVTRNAFDSSKQAYHTAALQAVKAHAAAK